MMPDLPISLLPYVGNTGYTDNDLLVIVNYAIPSGTTSNTTLLQHKEWILSAQTSLQYFVSATTPTEVVNSGDRWFNTNTGSELVYINDGNSSQWVEPFSILTTPDVGYYSTTGITISQTITWDRTYWGISGSTNVDITLPTAVNKDGYYLVIKDESGNSGTNRIRLTPASGTIDGNNYVDMNIDYMSLTLIARNGDWYII
jgi:hypothetical protein